MAMAVVYLSPLGFRTPLYRLGGAVARWDACVYIAARCRTDPLVTEGAHSKRALGHGSCWSVAIVLRQSAVVPDLQAARLLRVQSGCQGINLALELGDTAVSFLLALPRRRRGNALARQSVLHASSSSGDALPWSPGLGASLAGHVGALLIAAHLQTSARVARARALEISGVFGRSWSRMGAVVVAIVIMLIFIVAALGCVWRRLLQRRIQAAVVRHH